MTIERRFLAADGLELRAEPESRRISGYFALYDRFSPVYGKFRERIAPGFFDEAMQKSDVRALFNHDESRLLGRNRAGTLRLRSDSTGLYGEVDPVPATGTGDEVLENLRLGNLTGASFAFSMPAEGEGDRWAKAADGVWERTLLRAAELFDVSVVTNPFYPDTSVAARAATADLERSFSRWQEAHPEPPADPPATAEPDLTAERLRLAGL